MNRDIPWPQIPDDMSLEAYDLIDKLLIDNPLQRLGSIGAGEVKIKVRYLNNIVQQKVKKKRKLFCDLLLNR